MIKQSFNLAHPISRLGLLGNPIKQSLSPIIHEAFARQANLNINYECYLVQNSKDFQQHLKELLYHQRLLGLNVTFPFKALAFRLCDQLTDRARRSGSVNTLWLDNDRLLGDDTDGIGFLKSLQKKHPIAWSQASSILIIGTGNTCQSILSAMNLQAPNMNPIQILARDLSKIADLTKRFNAKSVQEALSPELIICTVPADSLSAQSLSHWLQSLNIQLKDSARFYHINYRNLSWQQDFNRLYASVIFQDGLGMLVEQAAFCFQRWLGFYPDVDVCRF